MSRKKTILVVFTLLVLVPSTGGASGAALTRNPLDYHVLARSRVTLKDYHLLTSGCNVGANQCATSSSDGLIGGAIDFADGTQLVSDRMSIGGVNAANVYQAFCNDCSLDGSVIRQQSAVSDQSFPAGAFNCPILQDGTLDAFINACNQLEGENFPLAFAFNDLDVTVLAGGSDCQFDCTGPDCPAAWDQDIGNGVCDLAPGTYGHVTVRNDGHINFMGGVYNLASYQNGKRVVMSFGGATTLNIADMEDLRLGDNVMTLGGCGDLRINYEGGRNRNLTMSLGKNGLITLDLCAPYALVRLGNSNFIGGHLFGNTVSSDLNNQGFCCVAPPSPTLTPTPSSTPTPTPSPTPSPTPGLQCHPMACRTHLTTIRFGRRVENDKLRLSGLRFPLDVDIDPPADGVVVVLSDSDGEIYRGTIPPGKFIGAPPRWKFRDPSGSFDGIKVFKIRKFGGQYKVRARIIPAQVPGLSGVLRQADKEIITITLIIGDACFSTTNHWDFPPPPITTGRRLRKCRQPVTGTPTPPGSPTPTPTPTPSPPPPTASPTPTPTASPTPTPTTSPTPIPTATPSPTPSATPSPTPSASPTPSPVPTASPTPTPTASPTPTPSPSPSPGAACPDIISFKGDGSAADLDTGWTGQSHDSKVINDGVLTLAVLNCAGQNRPQCGQCDLSGPLPNPPEVDSTNNQRCNDDTSVECTADSDCATGTCEFFFGAPLPLSSGAVPVCVTNEINGPVSGTVEVELGEFDQSVRLISHVFTGLLVDKPCPTCEGDTTALDGLREGTCSGGTRDGMSCDIGGSHTFFGNTSFDCPPQPGANIGSLDILLNLTTGTMSVALSSSSPHCNAPGFGSFKCFCGTCATAQGEPCMSDADCPAGISCGGKRCIGGPNSGDACTSFFDCSGGFCGRPGEASKPNACLGGVSDCVGNPADTDSCDEALCAGGPFDRLCEIESFRGCSSDSDCPAPGDSCTGKLRECYADVGTVGGQVQACGVPDPPDGSGLSNPTMASLFCIPPTTSAAVNSVAGLPGLGRLTLPGTSFQLLVP